MRAVSLILVSLSLLAFSVEARHRPNISDWESQLLPVHAGVDSLAELYRMTTSIDMSLDNARPESGWRHLIWPTTLRTSVRRIGQKSLDAFTSANTNLADVTFRMGAVPSHLRTVIRIASMSSLPGDVVARLLRRPLQSLEKGAALAERLASEAAEALADIDGPVSEFADALRCLQDSSACETASSSSSSSDNDRFVAATRLRRLEAAEQRLDTEFEKITRMQAALEVIEERLSRSRQRRSPRLTLANFIEKAVKLRQLWQGPVAFCRSLAKVSRRSQEALRQFAEMVGTVAEARREIDADARRELLKLLKAQGLEALGPAHLAHSMAKAFKEVVGKPVIASLMGLSETTHGIEQAVWHRFLDEAAERKSASRRKIASVASSFGAELRAKRRLLD